MQSKLGSGGLPLCLSGFTFSHRSLSTEMADHDRRREAMRSRGPSADPRIGFTRFIQPIGDGDNNDGDLHDCSQTKLTCAAKAA